MKRILSIVFLLCLNFAAMSQWPINQNIGSDSTMIRVGPTKSGGLWGGLVVRAFSDTTAANLTRIRQYEGGLLFTTGDSTFWYRGPGATKWFRFGSNTVTSSGWNIGGNLFPVLPTPYPTIGTLAPWGGGFGIMTNSVVRAAVPDGGFTLSNDTSATKVFTWNPTTKDWGYANWNNGGGSTDSIATTLIAYVDSLGSDATGTVGNPAKPFATINAALLATASATKRVIKVGLGTFASPTHAAYIKANTEIIGSGKPQFSNTVTGSTYPYVTSTAPTKLVGGTIFQGTFEAPNVSNLHIKDIGIDVGSAFIGGGAAQEGFIMWADTLGTPGTHTNQSGKVFRNNVICENISVLQKDTASLVHCFDIENCIRPVVNNISTWGGFSGFVSKNVGAQISNIEVTKTNANYYGIIIKQNTYAYSYNTLLDGFYIYNSAGLFLHNEDGSTIGMQNITVTNGFIFQSSASGITQLGDSLVGVNISNVNIINPATYGMNFSKIARSTISNNIVSAATLTGYVVSGSDVTLSGNKASGGFTYDYQLTGVGTCAPVLAYNNSGLSTTSNGGFVYNSYVFGGGNYGTAVSGTIYMPTDACTDTPETIFTLQTDTTTLVTFTAGARLIADTALFTDSTLYGSFYLDGNDTLVITGLKAVMNGGTSDTLGIQVYYNDTINVIGTKMFTNTLPINSTTVGTSPDADDWTGGAAPFKIPPGNWCWLKSPTVVSARKPWYLSVSLIGYKKRKN